MNLTNAGKSGAAAVALSLCFAAAPAYAGDDGQASLFTGLANTFGLAKQDNPDIDYRERSRLVLPPKMTLPPPGRSQTALDPAWPTNVEAVRAHNLKKLEDAGPSARDVANGHYVLIPPGADVKVTTSGFNRRGPSCRIPDPKTGACPEEPRGPAMNWNPLTWVGLQQKPLVTLGPEPERESLTDPPKGYRSPAEGVGAKVKN
ncbi:MAG TPA: hypothetical protein VN715_11395 [Roseiarcus sp.]|nr:hypothetical protein [Roseiarcus sp.]